MKRAFFTLTMAFLALAMFAQTIDDARHEIDNENYYKAKVILSKILKDGTADKAEAAYYLGNAYLKSDDADSARLFYKMVFNPDNKTAMGHVALGRLALLDKKMDEATTNFNRALQLTKNKNANVCYEIGDAYFRPNIIDLQQAIKYLEQAKELDSKNTTIVLALGDAYLANAVNDPTMGGKAMTEYETASRLNKDLAMAWIKIGRLASNGRIWDQATDAFNKALQIDKNYPIIHKELGTVYYYTKQYDKMIQEFKTYIDLSPGDVKARTGLLQMYFNNKDYDKAADEAAKGLQKDSNNIDFLRFLIYSDFEVKRYKDGYDAMKRFFALPGVNPKPRDYNYAVRLANAVNDTALGLVLFPQALSTDSTNCDLISEYAKFLYIAKHYDDATKQYLIKKQRCGGTLTSLDVYYLGRAYLIQDDSIDADTAFGEFISRNPTSPDGYYWRARTLLKIGKIEDCLSLPYYEKYIELTSSNPAKYKDNLIEAYQYCAACYSEKDKAKALDYLSKVLELDPDNEFAIDLKKQLEGKKGGK